jgi:hypothetical protein
LRFRGRQIRFNYLAGLENNRQLLDRSQMQGRGSQYKKPEVEMGTKEKNQVKAK